MSVLLEEISRCIEFGKINQASPFPPNMKGQKGADELTREALDKGLSASDILSLALMPGMERVGQKFAENKVFVPQMLMSAKSMTTAMEHLKPFFQSGEIKRKGVFVIGTVSGDLHDIGKNLVAMMVQGAGWEVIDLGVDVKTDSFMKEIENHPSCVIGLSALLTTTMENMAGTVKSIKEKYPSTQVMVGGAPLNSDFCAKIGADFFSKGAKGAIEYLNSI